MYRKYTFVIVALVLKSKTRYHTNIGTSGYSDVHETRLYKCTKSVFVEDACAFVCRAVLVRTVRVPEKHSFRFGMLSCVKGRRMGCPLSCLQCTCTVFFLYPQGPAGAAVAEKKNERPNSQTTYTTVYSVKSTKSKYTGKCSYFMMINESSICVIYNCTVNCFMVCRL